MNGIRKPNVGGARELIVQVVVNSTTMRSRSRWPPPGFIFMMTTSAYNMLLLVYSPVSNILNAF